MKANHGGAFDVEMTQRPGHATELSRRAITDGYELVVALGGDGTVNEVVNGFFGGADTIDGDTVLGLLPLGTGNDLVRTLGIPNEFPLAVQALNREGIRHVDVGKVLASGLKGPSEARYFLNIADFGSGGAIAERVNRTTKRFGPQLSFWWGIIATLISYRNPMVTVSIDGEGEQESVINNIIIANGRYFAGGLKPAPNALMDDGLFDIVTFGDIGFIGSLLNLPKLKRGTHLSHPKARFCQGKRVTARADRRVLVEADGEVVGCLPAVFEIIPRVLRVK